MKFIGIDLAWTYKNETGICIMTDAGEIEYLRSAVFSDEDIVELIKSCSHEDVCIAIDAPLVVPNETGSRAAEREFMSYKIHGHNLSLFVASRGFLTRSFGQIRGETLMVKIQEALPKVIVAECAMDGESSIVETFPSGICCGLFPELYPVKYKVKRKVTYEETRVQLIRLLERLNYFQEKEGVIQKFDLGISYEEINKKNHKHIEDKVDALLSVLGVYTIYNGLAEQKTFGTVEDGFITIPIMKSLETKYKEAIKISEKSDSKISITSEDIAGLAIHLGKLSKSIVDSSVDQVEIIRLFKNELLKLENISKKT